MTTLLQQATNSATLLQNPRIGDVILYEERNYYSRRVCQIAPSQTLFFGQVLQGDPINGQLSALGADAAATVVALAIVDNTGSGNFFLTIDGAEGPSTASITYSATPATVLASIQAATDALFGTNQIVWTQPNTTSNATKLASTIGTFSGSKFVNQPIGTCYCEITTNAGGTTFTINGVGTVNASTAMPFTAGGSVGGGAGVNQVDSFTLNTTASNVNVANGTTSTLGFVIQQPNGVYMDVTASTITSAAAWATAITTALDIAYGGTGTSSYGPVVTIGSGSFTSNIAITLTWSGSKVAKQPILFDVELDVSGTYNVTAGDNGGSTPYSTGHSVTTAGQLPTGSVTASCILLYDGTLTNVPLSAAAAAAGRAMVVTTSLQTAFAVCLVRHALVKPGYLLYQPNTTTGVEGASVADQIAANRALEGKGLIVRTGPVYTTNPDGSVASAT